MSAKKKGATKAKATPQARAPGRPRTLDRGALMNAVCESVASGTLVKDAADAAGVDPRRIRQWALDDEFAPLYARARDSQAHAMAEDALRIADGSDDESTTRLAAMVDSLAGVEEKDKDRLLNALAASAIQRDRLRVDARKWLTSKIAPKSYGERVTQEIEGAGGGPLQVVVRIAREGRRVTAS